MARTYPKIWFLRHGQTEWNAQYRLQGQLDSALTPRGISDAQDQARIMPDILAQSPQVFASPLGRVRQTAQIALGGAPYIEDPRLMEIHAGAWQGMLRSDIYKQHPEFIEDGASALDIYEAAEGGEGLAALEARIVDFLSELTVPTVIVAHGLLGQVLRGHVCNVPAPEVGQLSNEQGCVYLLENGQETVVWPSP
ncbi:histidine phosphatase family protein [Sulfitobacter sp. SK012]|uniref:histidine phosphatase family protein n=1 Tax=Sulfitobacter sp. SK012 TaxID=1389005 RepID=UPI000E0AA3EE|nr:histidine phosphatase family protein [Sulfitobacter sp. SK012]AXI46957.1 histidine phosphatase family protein [Sulfitobacter sp. SK012]